MSWTVEFCRDERDREPVTGWIAELRRGAGRQAVKKVIQAIDLLKENGLSLTTEHLHKIRGEVWELIATYQRNPYRILFYDRGGGTLVLLVGFHKKARAIPEAEIQRAERRADEDRKRHK
jgi:phage-related protein